MVGCSLSLSLGAVSVFVQLSLIFASLPGVKRYRVSVLPDPSSCSSNQTSPSENYICSGLVPGTVYNIRISAIFNCGDREGGTKSFFINLQGISYIARMLAALMKQCKITLCNAEPRFTTEVTVQPTYNQDASLHEVFATWMEIVRVTL